jgi:branched-chain amino acid transport system substrate-binding protein
LKTGTKRGGKAAPVIHRAVLWLALFLAVAAPASQSWAQTQKIGLSLPLSGNASLLAKQFLAGAELALKTLAADWPIELVTVDDGCDAEIADLAANDLRNAGVVLAAGFLCNEAVPPSAELFKDSGVPLLVAGARSHQLLKDAEKEDWDLFRIAPDDRMAAEAAFRDLSVRWRGVPWAVIDDGTVYGRTTADELRARMEEAGLPPVFADNFRPAQSTQAGLVRRLQRAGVSAAFVAGDADDVAILWSNVKDFDSKVEIAGGEALEALQWSPGARQVPDGLLAVIRQDLASLPAARAISGELVSAGLPAEPYVLLGYATMQIALEALAATPAETTENLASGSFDTVTGKVDFDETGQNRHNPFSLHVWRDGRFVEISEDGQ